MDEMIEQVAPVKVTLDDIDDLISALSPDELKELSSVDPDDSSLPPSMRCLYTCEKNVTGEVDRDKMLTHLKEEAGAIPDQEEKVQFVPGTIRGKQYVPKNDDLEFIKPKGEYDSDEEEDQLPNISEVNLDAEREREFKEITESATLDDIKEIADILGVAYQDHCHATGLKLYPEAEPNNTNIEEVLKQVENNDPGCIEINLNNVKGISQLTWLQFFAALARNTTVELLTATNCDLTDTVAVAITECLEQNRCLKFLTLDSNSIGGDMVVRIIRATAIQKMLEELRCSGQLNCKYLGCRIENDIAQALMMTPQLVKLGVTMEFRDSLNKTAVQLQKNLDKRRQTEDRTYTLKLDGKSGPKIVEEKPVFKKPKQ